MRASNGVWLTAFLVLGTQFGASKKSTKDWGKTNWSALETDWEDGDEEAELITERELMEKEYERRCVGSLNLPHFC